MATTMTNAVLALRARLDEATSAQWTDAELTTWLDEGAVDISRSLEYEAITTAAVTAGLSTYTPTITGTRINKIEFTETGDTQVYQLRHVDRSNGAAIWGTYQNVTTNRPEFWSAWGLPPSVQIKLFPVPFTAGTLTISYYRLALASTANSGNVDVPEGWIDLAYDYAEYRAFLRDRDDRWQQAKSRYAENVGRMLELLIRHTDQPGDWIEQPDTGNGYGGNFGVGWSGSLGGF